MYENKNKKYERQYAIFFQKNFPRNIYNYVFGLRYWLGWQIGVLSPYIVR